MSLERKDDVRLSGRDSYLLLYRLSPLPPKPAGSLVPDILPTFYTSVLSEAKREVIWSDDDVQTNMTWKPCMHTRTEKFTVPVMSAVDVITQGPTNDPYHYSVVVTDPYLGCTASYPFGITGRFDNDLPDIGDWDEGFVPPPGDLDGLKQRALNACLPVIKSELSLINSVIELKDFKSLPKLVPRAINFFKRVPPEVYQRLQRTRFKTKAVRNTRNVSSAYLQWKFAFAPLLSDIQGVRNALSRYERRLNDFITRSGRVQVKHFAYNWYESPAIVDDIDPNPQVIGARQFNFSRRTETYPTTFHAEIEYNYNYTRYQLEHARILAFLDAFGVNFNPAILWNALPWSFLVDWLIGVSRWLDQFKTTNMGPKINIRRCLWSVKRLRTIEVSRYIPKLTQGVIQYPATHTKLPVVRQSSYRRETWLPGVNSIESSGLNLNEFSLAAALVLARRPKRRQNRK
jgi:hypothetical protein